MFGVECQSPNLASLKAKLSAGDLRTAQVYVGFCSPAQFNKKRGFYFPEATQSTGETQQQLGKIAGTPTMAGKDNERNSWKNTKKDNAVLRTVQLGGPGKLC